MKILVLQEVYPSNENPYAQAWAHTRNLNYAALGNDVRVIAAAEKKNRTYQNIDIFCKNAFNDLYTWADVVVCHQLNLKFHMRALRGRNDKPLMLFFHGHEVMRLNRDYSRPFFYISDKKLLNTITRDVYDELKLKLVRRFIENRGVAKVGLIFVSQWMREIFSRNIKLDPELLRYRNAIIPNSIANVFFERHYQLSEEIMADFICIRQWDWSKHGVDLFFEMAKNNPEKSFHLYGKGNIEKHIKVPENVKIFNGFIDINKLPSLLNQYRCALLPTRVDSQGVMACEIATYGMPLITSDISVAREFLSEFENVNFINNSSWSNAVTVIPSASSKKDGRFVASCLCKMEVDFFHGFLKSPPLR